MPAPVNRAALYIAFSRIAATNRSCNEWRRPAQQRDRVAKLEALLDEHAPSQGHDWNQQQTCLFRTAWR